MKIVVLCGGLSTERNISFLSGTKVCRALRSRGHQAVLVDLFMGLEDVTDDPASLFEELPELKSLTFDGTAPDLEAVKESRKWKSPSLFGKGVLEICRMADIVYVALHGMNGEDGRVQATFDMLGIPYTGSGYLGAAIAMDKMLTKEMIKDKGVRTPAWKTFHAGAITSDEDLKQTAKKIASEIEAPCVVKTPTGGSSVGVYIVTSQDGIRPAVEKCLSFGPDILVEHIKRTDLFEYVKKRKVDEERRLLYVGFTRAKDYLVTLGNAKSKYTWLTNCEAGGETPVLGDNGLTLWHPEYPSTYCDIPCKDICRPLCRGTRCRPM